MENLVIVLRFIVGITLFVAGVSKLQNVQQFVQGVLEYKILSPILARWYGNLLPVTEICTGAFLTFGVGALFAAIFAEAMFASFAIAVAINLRRKRKMPCFCFGADTKDNMGGHTLVRIFLLMFFSLILIFILCVWPTETSALSQFRISSIAIEITTAIPTILLVIFGLLILSFIEASPWVIKAWTTTRPVRNCTNVVRTHKKGDLP